MGLAFKPNIDDLRESPANYIVQKVLQNNRKENIFVVEPNIFDHKEYDLSNYNFAIKKSDIIVFLVAHNEFKTSSLNIDPSKIVIDFCGAQKKE